MTLDSHQHFWHYDPIRDSWINEKMKVLKRDFLPKDLSPISTENKIDGCIAVQADQSEAETNFLVQLALENQFIKGVVGWIDLRAKNISERLDYFSQHKIIKGYRHIVQAEDLGFMTQALFQNGIAQLEKRGLAYDILIYPHQLQEAFELVKKFPKQKFVVDHLAKPVIKENEFAQWSKGIAQLSSREDIYCKLSGFTTEADWKSWTKDTFTRYFDFALEHFGTKRLMYGSDWPVCLVAASYTEQLNVVTDYISRLSLAEKQQIMGGNAVEFYNI
ncbi:MAG TPA: amidohydrolase family protein [Cyclobacteriaceae bacterium]|jgi:L-fuconolactonase|nr:amidohydrolase family protein [Cyclobacteriaceae bacterium]